MTAAEITLPPALLERLFRVKAGTDVMDDELRVALADMVLAAVPRVPVVGDVVALGEIDYGTVVAVLAEYLWVDSIPNEGVGPQTVNRMGADVIGAEEQRQRLAARNRIAAQSSGFGATPSGSETSSASSVIVEDVTPRWTPEERGEEGGVAVVPPPPPPPPRDGGAERRVPRPVHPLSGVGEEDPTVRAELMEIMQRVGPGQEG